MTRESKVPICSLIDFYQCIPDYEDVMHLPNHELDERLRHLRYMQKSYLDGRASPLFTTYFRGDNGYRREDYRDFLFPADSESCPKQCPYNGAPRSSKYDHKLTTFEGSSYGRECFASTPVPKDSVTTGSTLSIKSSKSAFSNGDTDTHFKPNGTKRRKNPRLKYSRSKPTASYFDSSTQYPGPSSFREEYECDEVFGESWTDKRQRSLPCSPVHRRSTKNVNSDRQKRSRLLSYLSTPDIRVPEEKPNYVFRAHPFPTHIFSNYLNKRREEKSNNRADSRRKRAEELQRTSFLPPSMRRRQKVHTITIRPEQPKTDDDSESRLRPESTSPDRFGYKGLSPYRKVGRCSPSNKRRSRLTSVEARDNLASLLRLQASRRKLEAESTAASEAAAAYAERKMRARATRLSPVWHSALSRPTTAEDLMLKAARRHEEAAERNRRRRRAIAAMRERVRAAPSLMERQSLRTASSLGGFSYRDSGLKSTKHTEGLGRPTTADVWRCYSNNETNYIRSHAQQTSHSPKRRRSRVIISNKNSFSDDEVQRQHRYNSKERQKHSFSYQKDLQEVFYDPHESDFGLHYRKQSSPSKPRSSVNHSPNYRSPDTGHSEDMTEEEPFLPPSRHSTSCNVNAGGRNSRADWSFSDSHCDDSQIPPELCRNGSSELRNGHSYGSAEHKHTEQSDEASVSRDDFGTFGCSSRRPFPPFLKSETWPTNSTKGPDHSNRSVSLGQYENGRMEAVTKRFEDISIKSSSPVHERVTDTFEDRNKQPWLNHCRSTQSSPQLRRRALHHDYKTIHDSIPRLDLALQREYFNEDNLRYNSRSPKIHLLHNRSSDTPTT